MHDSQMLFFFLYEFKQREMSVSIWQLICQSFRLLLGIILSVHRHANTAPVLSGGNIPGHLPIVKSGHHCQTYSVHTDKDTLSSWEEALTAEADFIVLILLNI